MSAFLNDLCFVLYYFNYSLTICLFLNYCYSDFFADDVTIYTKSKMLNNIEYNLQLDANAAKVWCKQNEMHIHLDKTSYMVLGTQYKSQDAKYLNLIIDNHDVKRVSQQNYWAYILMTNYLLQTISINYVLRFHRKYHFYGNCQQMYILPRKSIKS